MLNKLVAGAVALGVTLGGLAAAAKADTLADIKSRGRIVVAVDLGHPPYGMLDGTAQQTGSDIETAKLLADDMGVALEVVAVSGANRVPFLISNRVDVVIASFSITEERKKVIDYSRPYGVIPVVVAGPASETITDASGLAGQQVAVARGTTADIELTRAIKESGVDAEVVRYEDEATATTAVATGQQTLFAAALSTAQALAAQNPGLDMEVKLNLAAYPMAIGLRKNDEALKTYLDEWVGTNLHNGKLNGIYEKYFGQSLPAEMLD
ncbi:transporter substrate-binding domain-containing protein [Aureimonas frigidaquae]|uniref:Extracellular solute-binding protein n=1 Tax=Aureimonas frigidaquae TaxID=424757 RepID=A0A0P0Z2C2_9HYPH|nr:transporter substrate-binding domain-containing protein [Aureimonas frigidaquae]BAT28100.1 extracellular solute-binding protein [Aureimonas frigidaquae]